VLYQYQQWARYPQQGVTGSKFIVEEHKVERTDRGLRGNRGTQILLSQGETQRRENQRHVETDDLDVSFLATMDESAST
jgi:hypothetical protein